MTRPLKIDGGDLVNVLKVTELVKMELGVVVYTYNPSTGKVEGQELEASLDYTARLFQKQTRGDLFKCIQ
jgi:hypothetical protein